MTPMLVLYAMTLAITFIIYFSEDGEIDFEDVPNVLRVGTILYIPIVILFYGAYFLYEMYFQ